MQRARISFPVEVDARQLEFDIDIIRLDSQRAGQHRFFLSELTQMTITEGDLLQYDAVAGIEVSRALQTMYRLFLFALATLDIALELENTGVVRQDLGGEFQFGESGVIIEIALIKILGACEVCFTRIRVEPKCGLNCRFSQCQPCRRMVVTEEIKAVVSRSEQAKRFEK